MSALTKDDLMKQLKTFIGTNTSDEALSFVENVSDTIDELHNKAEGDGTDWKKKYEENDAEWRQRYTDRFFSGTNDGANKDDVLPNTEPEPEPEPEPKNMKFEDLFNPDNGKE